MKNQNNLGHNLLKARKEKGLTQRELADLIGAKHNSVSNWEHNINKPDPDTISLICGVLEISPNDLLGSESPKSNLSNCSETSSVDEDELLHLYRAVNRDGQSYILRTARMVFGNPDMQKDGNNPLAI